MQRHMLTFLAVVIASCFVVCAADQPQALWDADGIVAERAVREAHVSVRSAAIHAATTRAEVLTQLTPGPNDFFKRANAEFSTGRSNGEQLETDPPAAADASVSASADDAKAASSDDSAAAGDASASADDAKAASSDDSAAAGDASASTDDAKVASTDDAKEGSTDDAKEASASTDATAATDKKETSSDDATKPTDAKADDSAKKEASSEDSKKATKDSEETKDEAETDSSDTASTGKKDAKKVAKDEESKSDGNKKPTKGKVVKEDAKVEKSVKKKAEDGKDDDTPPKSEEEKGPDDDSKGSTKKHSKSRVVVRQIKEVVSAPKAKDKAADGDEAADEEGKKEDEKDKKDAEEEEKKSDVEELPKPFPMPHIKVESNQEAVRSYRKRMVPAVHGKDYWIYHKLKQEQKWQQGSEKMKRDMLEKELSEHYSAQLTKDHMKRHIDRLRREHAQSEYGPDAQYRPFDWGEYDEPSDSKQEQPQQQDQDEKSRVEADDRKAAEAKDKPKQEQPQQQGAQVDDKQPERDDLAATFTEADLKQYAKVADKASADKKKDKKKTSWFEQVMEEAN